LSPVRDVVDLAEPTFGAFSAASAGIFVFGKKTLKVFDEGMLAYGQL
jgi:hypothetical protein